MLAGTGRQGKPATHERCDPCATIMRYRRARDIGANLGLHSIVLARCGFEVKAFEPDPWHFGLLKDNLAANRARVEAIPAAVSTADGEAQFVRVLGNTTGSHLAGSK